MRCLLLFLVLCFCTSCLNNDKEAGPGQLPPEAIYLDYKVSAEEGRENVTVLLQFRSGAEDSPGVLLPPPGKVSLDSMELKPDSAKLAGTFYEVSLPLAQFAGEHIIIYTDSRNKEIRQEFSFRPFTIAEEMPEQRKKAPFTIQLQNFPAEPTMIRLVMIDTDFDTPDVNLDMEIENGQILIDEEKLARLAIGSITLEIYREEERSLENVSQYGGRMTIAYSLQRYFEFVD